MVCLCLDMQKAVCGAPQMRWDSLVAARRRGRAPGTVSLQFPWLPKPLFAGCRKSRIWDRACAAAPVELVNSSLQTSVPDGMFGAKLWLVTVLFAMPAAGRSNRLEGEVRRHQKGAPGTAEKMCWVCSRRQV